MYKEDRELYDNVFPLSSIRDSPLFRIAVKLNSDYSGSAGASTVPTIFSIRSLFMSRFVSQTTVSSRFVGVRPFPCFINLLTLAHVR